MELYIANASKQLLQFEFRLIEQGKISRYIRPGNQTCFRDLSTPQIESIARQHERYGMYRVDQISGQRGKIDYVYSIDRPVKPEVLSQLSKHNEAVLQMRGHETRKKLAIAINNDLDKSLGQQNRPENMRGFDLTVVEREPVGGYRTDIAEPVAETIKLDLGAPRQGETGDRTRRGRRKRAA